MQKVINLAPIPICNSQKRPSVKILIISDAWYPQINGVVRTLQSTVEELDRFGHEIRIVGTDSGRWSSFPLPSYPEIKLEFFAYRRLARVMSDFHPDLIHIATEGLWVGRPGGCVCALTCHSPPPTIRVFPSIWRPERPAFLRISPG